jgi:hypothetical protein
MLQHILYPISEQGPSAETTKNKKLSVAQKMQPLICSGPQYLIGPETENRKKTKCPS